MNLDGHKLHYHLKRVTQWQESDIFPLYVEVSPVGNCNHRCTFCALDYLEYRPTKLSYDMLLRTLSCMAKMGVKSIMYAGEGEPLLHPDMNKILEDTYSKGIDVSITTNGVHLMPSIADIILNTCSWIKISCNAGDGETYSKIHRCDKRDWDKVWENLDYIVKHKCLTGSHTTIGIQAMVLPENIDSLDELTERCRDTAIDYVVFKPYSQHKASKTQEYKDLVYTGEYIDKLKALEAYTTPTFKVQVRYKAIRTWNEQNKNKDYQECLSVPYFWAYIMSTGDVYGCNAFLQDAKFNYGNINAESFQSIWLGEKRKQAREYMKTLDVSQCRKGCRMHNINKFLWDISKPIEHKNFI